MGTERRQHERKPLRASGQLLLANRAPMEIRTVDLSLGGAGVVAPVNLAPKLTCLVRIALPIKPKGSALIEAQAAVAHSVLSSSQSGFLIGLQFTSVSAASATAIKQFLRE